jgi:hypothetical protein
MFRQDIITDITQKNLVKYLDKYLYEWAYQDFKKESLRNGQSKMLCFFLGCYFIDALAEFFAGADKAGYNRNSSKRLKDFLKRYLPQYNPDIIHANLRYALAHPHSAGASYVFTHNNKAGSHLGRLAGNKIILNLEDFCADLKKAYRKFREDILADKTIFANTKKRIESLGLMKLIRYAAMA